MFCLRTPLPLRLQQNIRPYGYAGVVVHRSALSRYASCTPSALFRDRRDALAGDSDLLSILTGEVSNLTPIQTMKLECYLYSLFDAYLYAIYLVRWGYLDNRTDLYLMFRNMLSKDVALPHVINVWNCQRDDTLTFQNEYPEYFVSMVNDVIQETLSGIQSRSSV